VGQCQCAKVEHKIKLVYFDGRYNALADGQTVKRDLIFG